MNGRHKLILLAILLLAAFLRLYKISEVPPGVNRDEASIGYTAYSLLQTGKDEYGRTFPLSFQSFGDWKLPLYIYTTVPFVKLFGLNELAVRLPSAIAGIMTVLLTYLLVLELFEGKKSFIGHWVLSSGFLAILSALFLALSPWHIHLSRVESESNVAVFLTVAATLFFLKGLKQKPIFVALSLPLFALTYYTYHGNHVFTTLFLIGLCVLYHKQIPRTKIVIGSALLSIVLVLIILSATLLSADKTKLSGISIFGDSYVVHGNIELPRTDHPDPNNIIARLTHNRFTYAAETVAQNYIKAFSPEFLFIKGGGNRAHNIPNFGNLYLVEAPFFYLGIFLLLFAAFLKNSTFDIRHSTFLFWWLLISPVAASITKDAPHTNRMFVIFPLPPILVALGLVWLGTYLPKQKLLRGFIVVLLALAFSANIALYLDRYFVHFPLAETNNWGIKYKKLNEILSAEENKTKHLVITNPEYSPYIFLLFYSRFDPAMYQKTAMRYPPTDDAFVHVKAFGRFEFRAIDWKTDPQLSDTLLVDINQWKVSDTGVK
ncbi:MAG: hypothetical protein AAB803_02045 [Patescibacteria group bacterium]